MSILKPPNSMNIVSLTYTLRKYAYLLSVLISLQLILKCVIRNLVRSYRNCDQEFPPTYKRKKKGKKARAPTWMIIYKVRSPARSSRSGDESLELLSSWCEELLARLMSIRGVLGVLSELPGVAGVVTSTMPGIRPAADSPCIQIRILVCCGSSQ